MSKISDKSQQLLMKQLDNLPEEGSNESSFSFEISRKASLVSGEGSPGREDVDFDNLDELKEDKEGFKVPPMTKRSST